MATKLGSTTISKLYLGSTEITKAYLGSTEVYSSGAPVTNDAFELTVETTAANETFLLPMLGVTSIDVDWGDGTVDTGITSNNPTHTYATAGTHSISVTGSATSVFFYNSGSQDKVRTVTNLGALGWTNFSQAFRDCANMTSFECGDTDTSNVGTMILMFLNCSVATTIDVSGFDTSSVTDMWLMFSNCSAVTTIDTSGFNTSSVNNRMLDMFRGCSSLTNLDVSGFDTSNVINMAGMFSGCSSLINLDVSGFSTPNVIRMNNMFNECSSLTTLDVSGFDTSSVTGSGLELMFKDCSSLTELDVSGFDTSGVTTITQMFWNCSLLTTLNVSGFNTANVNSIFLTFSGCSSLENLDITGWDVTSLTNGSLALRSADLALTTAQYDATLIAWAAQAVQSNVTIHFGDAQYTAGSAAETARNTLVSTYGWTITDGGALDDYAANSISPEFVADFANDYYRVASNESTFDNALTFSRSGNATMVDSDGLIKWAPHNSIKNSESASIWIAAIDVSNSTATQPAPYGSGEVLLASATSTNPMIRISGTTIDLNATEYKDGVCGAWVRTVSGSTTVTISEATAGGSNYSVDTNWQYITHEDVQRFLYLSWNSQVDLLVCYPRIYRSDLGGMVSNPDPVDASDPNYVPTTGTARYLARRGHHVYNGTSWVNEGILVESESRVNQITQSETFSNWQFVGGPTITTNQATSPSGQNTASKLVEGTSISRFLAYTDEGTGSGVSSIFLKAAERSFATVCTRDGNDQYAITVDLSSGQVTQTYNPNSVTRSYFIEDYSNGWWRVSIAGGYDFYSFVISPATQGTFFQGAYGAETYQGDGSSGIYIWGAQAEDGALTPSSYIPTSGSTVTRAAEVLTVPAANVTAGQTAYSIAIDAYILADASVKPDPLGWYGINSDLYRHEYRGTSMLVNQRLGDGINNNNFLPISNNYKIASRGTATENQTAANGTAADVDAQSGTPALNGQNIQLGQHGGSFDTLQIIKSLILWDDDIGTAGIEEASS